jgi:hypothetical protein
MEVWGAVAQPARPKISSIRVSWTLISLSVDTTMGRLNLIIWPNIAVFLSINEIRSKVISKV